MLRKSFLKNHRKGDLRGDASVGEVGQPLGGDRPDGREQVKTAMHRWRRLKA
jgi:hypothetical protein